MRAQPASPAWRTTLSRWTRFSAVGAAGLAVQLAALALFSGVMQLGLLLATALSVECAVLHNFLWHYYSTWKDRPCADRSQVIARLIRFHVANGMISLFGNSAMTWVLVTDFGIHYILANLLAVVPCSVANFLVCDRFAFCRPRVPALMDYL